MWHIWKKKPKNEPATHQSGINYKEFLERNGNTTILGVSADYIGDRRYAHWVARLRAPNGMILLESRGDTIHKACEKLYYEFRETLWNIISR